MNPSTGRRGRALAAVAALVVVACQSRASAAPAEVPPAATTASPPDASGPAASPGLASPDATTTSSLGFTMQTYPVTQGAHPHDVAVASDGGVWYTGQLNGTLGWLDPDNGTVKEVDLPAGAAPHGVVTGPDGAAWVTDQGLQAIVRVTPGDLHQDVFPVPGSTSPHTAVFDHDGILWFTGAAGFIGRLEPVSGKVDTFPTPRGAGPYGIAVTPSNDVWFVSLQQSYLGKVDKATGAITVMEPPTAKAGTRRVWSDSKGRLWITYWDGGKFAVYDPSTSTWRERDLPGDLNQPYSMYVDELDAVWMSDFGRNAIVRFDPATDDFQTFASDTPNAAVRQMTGRPGEAWGAESGLDRLVVVRYAQG